MQHYNFRSVSALSRQIGLKRPENLYQIKKGNNRISHSLADRICSQLPEISKGWLMTGEPPMLARQRVHSAYLCE